MKTLRNLFGIKVTKKTVNSIYNELDMNAMLMIKGGDGEDGDYWPPKLDE